MVCYSVTSQASLASVQEKWWPELQYHGPGVPMILVGTHSEARAAGDAEVSEAQAQACAKAIGAAARVECSAATQEGVQAAFGLVRNAILAIQSVPYAHDVHVPLACSARPLALLSMRGLHRVRPAADRPSAGLANASLMGGPPYGGCSATDGQRLP